MERERTHVPDCGFGVTGRHVSEDGGTLFLPQWGVFIECDLLDYVIRPVGCGA